MIKATIESKNSDTLIIELPCNIRKLYNELHSVGIMIPPNKVRLTDSKYASIRVKLHSDNEIGNHLIQIFNNRNNLKEVNAVVYLVTTADDSIKNELEQKILNNQYGMLTELTIDICQMIYNTKLVSEVFYFPLEGIIYDSEYGSTYTMGNSLLADYESEIREALKQYMSQDINNMAKYYRGAGSEKLISADWDLVYLNGELFGKVDICLLKSITAEETEQIRQWIIGQNADGIGEGFEQQDIEIDERMLNVSFWSSGNDYFVYTQSEMDSYIDNKNGMQYGGM